MPHLTIEYTANLDEWAGDEDLLLSLHELLRSVAGIDPVFLEYEKHPGSRFQFRTRRRFLGYDPAGTLNFNFNVMALQHPQTFSQTHPDQRRHFRLRFVNGLFNRQGVVFTRCQAKIDFLLLFRAHHIGEIFHDPLQRNNRCYDLECLTRR